MLFLSMKDQLYPLKIIIVWAVIYPITQERLSLQWLILAALAMTKIWKCTFASFFIILHILMLILESWNKEFKPSNIKINTHEKKNSLGYHYWCIPIVKLHVCFMGNRTLYILLIWTNHKFISILKPNVKIDKKNLEHVLK